MSEQSEVERLSDKLIVEIASAAVDSYLHHEIERDGWTAKDTCYIEKITTTAKPILDALIAAVRAEPREQQPRSKQEPQIGQTTWDVAYAWWKAEAESLREQLKQAQESNEQLEQHWRRMYDERWADAAKLAAEVARLREAGRDVLGFFNPNECDCAGAQNPCALCRLRAALADPGSGE